MWTVCNKSEIERSLARAFPNSGWLAMAIIEKFQADVQLHPWVWQSSKIERQEQVWQYGQVSVRYRLLSAQQEVVIMSVSSIDVA